MLTCQADAFSLPSDLHYLNCAYMSPLSKKVEEAGIKGVQSKRNPSLIVPEDFFKTPLAVKRLFADLIGSSSPDRISLLPSVSYGVAIAANNLDARRGQNIVLLHEQFPSNLYTWRRLADEQNLELRTILPHDTRVDRSKGWNESILEAIDSDTLAVALPIVHWTDGTLFDLESIGSRARDFGAALVIDGTQSIGALPFDVARIKPDALIVASYKWLLGPYSCGLAWWGDRFAHGTPLEESWLNRLGSEDFASLVEFEPQYHKGSVRYDVGEKSNFALLPMLEAALEQVLEWTPEGIQEYDRKLLSPWTDTIRDLGFQLEDEADRGSHLVGIRMPPGLEVATISEVMRAKKIFVSVRGDAIRISPNVYNDMNDMVAFVDALKGAVH
jgi:selenocysteine lyase/cysteine desulfurase